MSCKSHQTEVAAGVALQNEQGIPWEKNSLVMVVVIGVFPK